MRHNTFLQGVGAAAAMALLGSIAATALAPLVGSTELYRVLVPALGLAYLFYLLSRSDERVGRVTTLTLWSAVALAAWLLELPMGLYLTAQLGTLWLIRSLYFHSSALAAVMDLALIVLGVAAAFWAAVHTGSAFLAVWSFFLVQALFVEITPSMQARAARGTGNPTDTDNFERARRRAEAAIRALCAR